MLSWKESKREENQRKPQWECLSLLCVCEWIAWFGSAQYTQQKYNLFREETEGYSKLIAELSELPTALAEYTSTRRSACALSTFAPRPSKSHSDTELYRCKGASEVIKNLQSLIGFFDLDPNRVLDLVLEDFIKEMKAHVWPWLIPSCFISDESL